ncbi:MAG TPA: NADH-quinone oxidoreductase subunit C [Solirubrobacterales bacterium]|nr:NADH-quinone oxidoreductase subunit C [Solirubrobacterales bacterium]
MIPSTPPDQSIERVDVAASDWRDACQAALERGERFCGAFAAGWGSAPRRWSALFADGASTRVLSTVPTGDELPSIVDLVPAANWDEREAHDLYGLGFDGHAPLLPLVSHPSDASSWTVPVEGEGVFEVAVGPIHAGVIESGHFRFHVVGERILHLDPRLFYKHRGLERAAEGRQLAEGLAYAQRACGACAVANSVAYALACESVLGLAPARELRRARTLLLELERLYNHLNDIAAVCAGVGFASGNMAFAALKERALRLNRDLSGHRFLFGSVEVGGSCLDLSAQAVDRARGELRELGQDTARVWREIQFSPSVQARLEGVGVLGHDDAARFGAVGPAARAAGVSMDTRAVSPGLWYGSSFTAAVPPGARGDVAARLEVRALELVEVFSILEELLRDPVRAGTASPDGAPAPIGVARVESPRGETVCVVEPEMSRIGRLHLRTGSYANWPALAFATADNLLPDFPLINKSFELCYACSDR